MNEPLGDLRAGPAEIRSFLRRARNEILAEWRMVARTLPGAHRLPSTVLVDHIPDLLDELADLVDELARDPVSPQPCEAAHLHALDRLENGFDIATVVQELSQLRRCILVVWSREHAELSGEVVALDLALDQAIATSVGRYVDARERTLAAFVQLSGAAASARGLDELLQRLLSEFVAATPAADVAGILLLDGDRLRLRAAVGLEEELAAGFSVAAGEGFAGRILAERRPLELRAAYLDPLVHSPAIRRRHVHALYGLPLVHGGRELGVAWFGSLSTHDLSRADRELFATLVAWAAEGVHDQVARQELLAVVSHDLRNPLGTIELSATMLLTQPETDHRARKHLEMMQRSCARMEHLIDDLVDAAAIQAGRLDLEVAREPADAILDEALELGRSQAAEHGIALAGRGNLAGVVLVCDRDRLLQALGNLLEHALRRCRADDSITMGGERAGDRVELWIADTGPDLDREQIDHLFEPSGRGDGMGLYIARGIVEAHGGRIAVEGVRGAGARILLSLPVAR